MKTHRPLRFWKSVSFRLLIYTVVGILMLSVISTGIQIYTQYHRDIRQLEATFDYIEKVHVPSISANLFEVNDKLIGIQLQGLLNFPGIVYAEVREEKQGYRYRRMVGDPDLNMRIFKTFDLAHTQSDDAKPFQLGRMMVGATYGKIHESLWSQGVAIGFGTFVQIFLMAIAVFLIAQYTFARPLAQMADYTERLDVSNLDAAFHLRPRRRLFQKPDEIERVADAFNNLRIRLRDDFAKREEMQRRLAESESRFRSLTDNLPIGVYRISPMGLILFANPALAGMFGHVSPSELEGTATADLYFDVDDRRMMRPLYAGTHFLGPIEIQFRKKDGAVFWGSIRARRFEDKDGNLLSVDGTIEDISVRKTAEEAARRRTRELETLYLLGQEGAEGLSLERMFHSAINRLKSVLDADMIVLFLRDGEVLRVRAHSQVYSHEAWYEEVSHEVGKCLCGLAAKGGKPVYSPDVHTDARCVLEECKRAGLRSFAAIPLEIRKENIGVLGVGATEPTDFETFGSFLETAAHTLAIGIKNILLYRSLEENGQQLERRLAELELSRKYLRQSEHRFRSFFDSNPEGVMLLDFEGRIRDVNLAVARITGYEKEAMQGSELPMLMDEESKTDIRSFLEGIQNGILNEKPFEVCCLRPGGISVPVSIRSWLVRDEADELLALGLFLRDMSTEKALAEQKETLERQLQHTQKMEAIGTLAGGIAHDFNNILSGIIGFAELAIEHGPGDNPRLAHFHQRLLEACGRAKELVEQILRFSRQGPTELQPASLAPLVKEVIQFLRSSLPATIEISSRTDADRDRVLCDLTQMHQVLVNLCTNAYHAMREGGGLLTVSMKSVRIDSVRRFQGLEFRPGPALVLEVSDTGHGIPSHCLERVFEPYFTTKEPGEGTGLGLSVTFGIVKSHDGLIEFESDEGVGTTFRVYLPVFEQAVDEREEPTPSIARGSGQRILVVDDELFFIDVLKEHLESLSYDVVGLQSSRRALESIRAHPDYFDLVVTDQTMPELTGVELIRELRKIRGDLPIILCTGFSETVSESTAAQYGISRFLMKPVHRAVLADAVHQLLEGVTPHGTDPGHR